MPSSSSGAGAGTAEGRHRSGVSSEGVSSVGSGDVVHVRHAEDGVKPRQNTLSSKLGLLVRQVIDVSPSGENGSASALLPCRQIAQLVVLPSGRIVYCAASRVRVRRAVADAAHGDERRR